MDAGLIGSFNDWWAHPFKADGSVLNWVAFLGLFIIAAWMWNTVLISISE